jgi:hypothetical protein
VGGIGKGALEMKQGGLVGGGGDALEIIQKVKQRGVVGGGGMHWR